MGPIHYRISWETSGPLPRDSSAGDQTKEVIGGGVLMSSDASVNFWHPFLIIPLGIFLDVFIDLCSLFFLVFFRTAVFHYCDLFFFHFITFMDFFKVFHS